MTISDPTLPAILTAPTIIDWRGRLPRKDWSIGTREATKFITLHYNGGKVKEANQSGSCLLSQLVGDATWQMRPGGLGAKEGGDGLQYHYVIGAEPQVYQCRDELAMLWHCANAVGNAQSISIHVPVGQDALGLFPQPISDEHWALVVQLAEWLLLKHNLPYTAFRGHWEWSSNACPGNHLKPRLLAWRAAKASAQPTPQPSFTYYTVKNGLALVRTAPSADERKSRVVLTLRQGTPEATIGIREIVTGDWAGSGVSRSNKWLWLFDGRGFIHSSAMKLLLPA